MGMRPFSGFSEMKEAAAPSAVITNIQGFSIHDGPGIRTVVFFKGCPLACRWCANPECIAAPPQMGFIATLCTHCGQCRDACTNGSLAYPEDTPHIDHARCTACGACRDRCYYGALVRYGASMTVDEVWDAVRRDRIFYDTSGGGVTASGGEPLLWAGFIRELFALCRGEGIDTCMETCGCADPEALLQVLPWTDRVLFDLKLMDPQAHKTFTGMSNGRILENAALVLEHGTDVIFRQPLIPGISDSRQNIDATAAFLAGLGPRAGRLELMPYHRMGQSKYKALGMPYLLEELGMASEEQAETIKNAYSSRGIQCTISR